MRRSTILVAVFAALVFVLPLSALGAGAPRADRYIVVLKNAVDSSAVANLHAVRYGASVEHVWSSALHGYSAVIPNDRVAALRADQNVAYVELDGIATATAQTLPWGIDKIDVDASSTHAGDGSGAISNVDAYVIDTGIDTSHPDLNVVEFRQYANGPPRDQGAELRRERQLVRRHLRNQLRRGHDRTACRCEHEPRRPAEHRG